MKEKTKQDLLDKLIGPMIRKAEAGLYFYGSQPPEFLAQYTRDVQIGDYGVRLIFSRDVGHHSGGWFKNPDYERCYHLSLSFRAPDGTKIAPGKRIQAAPQIHKLAGELCKLFYSKNLKFCWAEPPFSKVGKELQVWHYRVFCDGNWNPIMPRREVYSKEFTAKNWRSFSDLHGRDPDTVVDIN